MHAKDLIFYDQQQPADDADIAAAEFPTFSVGSPQNGRIRRFATIPLLISSPVSLRLLAGIITIYYIGIPCQRKFGWGAEAMYQQLHPTCYVKVPSCVFVLRIFSL